MVTIITLPSLTCYHYPQDLLNIQGFETVEIIKQRFSRLVLISADGEVVQLDSQGDGEYFLFSPDPLSPIDFQPPSYLRLSSGATSPEHQEDPVPADFADEIIFGFQMKKQKIIFQFDNEYRSNNKSLEEKQKQKELAVKGFSAISNLFYKRFTPSKHHFSTLESIISPLLGDFQFLSSSLNAEFEKIEQQKIANHSDITLAQFIQQNPHVLPLYEKAKLVLCECSIRLQSSKQVLEKGCEISFSQPSLEDMRKHEIFRLIQEKRDSLSKTKADLANLLNIDESQIISKMKELDNALKELDPKHMLPAIVNFSTETNTFIEDTRTKISRVVDDLKVLQTTPIEILKTINLIRIYSTPLKQFAVLLQVPTSMKKAFDISKRRVETITTLQRAILEFDKAVKSFVQEENKTREIESLPILQQIWSSISQSLPVPDVTLSAPFPSLASSFDPSSILLNDDNNNGSSSSSGNSNNAKEMVSSYLGFQFDINHWLPSFEAADAAAEKETPSGIDPNDSDALYSLFLQAHSSLNPLLDLSNAQKKSLESLNDELAKKSEEIVRQEKSLKDQKTELDQLKQSLTNEQLQKQQHLEEQNIEMEAQKQQAIAELKQQQQAALEEYKNQLKIKERSIDELKQSLTNEQLQKQQSLKQLQAIADLKQQQQAALEEYKNQLKIKENSIDELKQSLTNEQNKLLQNQQAALKEQENSKKLLEEEKKALQQQRQDWETEKAALLAKLSDYQQSGELKRLEATSRELEKLQSLDPHHQYKKIMELKNKKNDLKNALALVTLRLLSIRPS